MTFLLCYSISIALFFQSFFKVFSNIEIWVLRYTAGKIQNQIGDFLRSALTMCLKITVNILQLNLPSFCLLNKLELSVLTDALVTNTERLYSLPRKCIIQVILFEIDCAIFYTNLHELFCQFISWTNWINSGNFMDNCWMPCQVMADMEKFYDDFIIINLYRKLFTSWLLL